MSGSGWSNMSESILIDKYPLHRACRDGEVVILGTLLQEAMAKDHLVREDAYYGWTPSHWAAYFGRLECLRVLSGMNKHGYTTPVDLRTSRFSQTPLHIAAFAGHPQCLQWLLQTGAAADARDYLGETPLHKASRSGSTECVSLLAAQRAGLGLLNNNGQSAAKLAEACGHSNLAQYVSQLEASQGTVRDNTCSITKSIPSHGINGGAFPQIPSTASQSPKTVLSSNGYYGFQPQQTNGQHVAATNGSDSMDDSAMDTDTPPVTNGVANIENGSVSNGSSQDITLDLAVSKNQIAIAGRKRSREESPMPDMKRTRREELAYQSAQITQATRDVINTVSDKLTTYQNSSLNSGAPTVDSSSLRGATNASDSPSQLCASMARARIKQRWIWVV